LTASDRVEILGVGVDPLSASDLMPTIERMIANGAQNTIAYANVHVLNQAQNDRRLQDFLNAADLVYCDGNGVRLGARVLGQTLPSRMTGADWIWDLAATAEGRWRWRARRNRSRG
jgi:N-acetylglucosaminyldiphosphoundecaprenol N-acetyl-beta-D-mannosaminyltransferase